MLSEDPERAEQAGRMSSYAEQKFFEAMYSLVGDGSIEMRITYAANELNTIQAQNLPASMRVDFAALVRELTSKPLSNDAGFIPRAVDRDECNRLAQKILSMTRSYLAVFSRLLSEVPNEPTVAAGRNRIDVEGSPTTVKITDQCHGITRVSIDGP